MNETVFPVRPVSQVPCPASHVGLFEEPNYESAVGLQEVAHFPAPKISLHEITDQIIAVPRLQIYPSAVPQPLTDVKDDSASWIGVDFDGTLVEEIPWTGDPSKHGPPVEAMISAVKKELEKGTNIRIFTARVSKGNPLKVASRFTVTVFCIQHFGRALPITAEKDMNCLEIWDDRAREVVWNQGKFAENVHLENIAMIDDRNAHLEENNKDLHRRIREAEALAKNNELQQQISDSEAQAALDKRDETIASLNARIVVLGDKINQQDGIIAGHAEECSALLTRSLEFEQLAKNRLESNRRKNREALTLEAKIEEQESEIQQLKAVIEEMQEADTEVIEGDGDIDGDIDDVAIDSAVREAAISVLGTASGRVMTADEETAVHEATDEIGNLHTELEELNDKVVAATQDAIDLKASLVAERVVNDQLKQRVDHQQDHIARLVGDVNGKARAYDEVSRTIRGYETEVLAVRAELTRTKAALSEAQAGGRRLSQRVAEMAKQIGLLHGEATRWKAVHDCAFDADGSALTQAVCHGQDEAKRRHPSEQQLIQAHAETPATNLCGVAHDRVPDNWQIPETI